MEQNNQAPTTGTGAEFVVIETVEQLRDAQEEMQDKLATLRQILQASTDRIRQVESSVEVHESSWRLLQSGALLVTPIILAYILDFKSRQDYLHTLSPFEPLITMLLCISVCIGLPVLAAGILEHTAFLSFQSQQEQQEDVIAESDAEDLSEQEEQHQL